MHNFDLKCVSEKRVRIIDGVINFSKNYWNVVAVPVAVAVLLERRNGREQQL